MSWIKGRDSLVIIFSTLFSISMFLAGDFLYGMMTFKEVSPRDLEPKIELDRGWYELKRNYNAYQKFGPYTYRVRTDADGFRVNHTGSEGGSKGTTDLVFLGDSFTYGVNGPWEETFVGMIANRFPVVRVINGGVVSYSPTPYLYQYKRIFEEKHLRKDHLVIVGIDISDVQDEAGYWLSGAVHPEKTERELRLKRDIERRREIKINSQTTLKGKLSEYLHSIRLYFRERLPTTRTIYYFLRYNLLSSYKNDELYEHPRSAFTYSDWGRLDSEYAFPGSRGYKPLGVRKGLEKLSTTLGDLARLVEKNDGKIFYLIYPWPAQIKFLQDKFSWSGFVTGLCEGHRCSGVIDVIKRFRQEAEIDSDWYHLYYVSGDQHFNSRGNAVIADEIEDYLRRSNSVQ